jgi:hypothetical protein
MLGAIGSFPDARVSPLFTRYLSEGEGAIRKLLI